MGSLQNFITSKLVFRASVIFTFVLILLIGVDQFITPIRLVIMLVSLFSLPFFSLSLWIELDRKKYPFLPVYFCLFELSLTCFIIFGWLFYSQYFTILGQALLSCGHLFLGAGIFILLEKFARQIDEQPLKTKARLNFY